MGWEDALTVVENEDNKYSPCAAYQHCLNECESDVICMVHDDVIVHDPDWHERVMDQFNKPNTVAVGFGGATGLGNKDLYRKPFNIWNMARTGYASNQTDAEVHGERFTGSRRVATLDAFFLAVRSSFIVATGGWPTANLTHHCLDLWLACEAARQGKEVWMVGCSVSHLGGRSSAQPIYKDAKWLQGHSLESDHVLPHKWLFNNYRDVLPLEIK